MNPLKNSTNEKILFQPIFYSSYKCFCTCFRIAKIVHGELVFCTALSCQFMISFFPENYAVLYDSLALAKFDMFKDEIPKLRAIAEERHLDKIKMSHRLMDGDLLNNIKNVSKKIK
jgi:hypothetical protein